MQKAKLTQQEKIDILQQKIKAAKQKISRMEGIEKKKQRKHRARLLIEVAAFFFGDHYEQIHGSIKTQAQTTIDLKKKIDQWIKQHY